MHQQSSDSPATVTAVLGASPSSSNVSTGMRKVRLSDRELFQRVQRIAVPNEPVDLRGLTARRGWRRVTAGMDIRFRSLHVPISTPPFQTRQCQVVVGAEIQAQADELMSLLRAPTESESNALLRALYGSRFIYSSLVHVVSNGSVFSPSANVGAPAGQQLTVRTASFAHAGEFNPFKRRSSTPAPSRPMLPSDAHLLVQHQAQGSKNEQCCYIELLTPTQAGFKMVFCSLDAAEVAAGKAPPDRVVALHPLSGWLTVEPTPSNPGTLRLTFQAAFPGNLPGCCDSRVAEARLLFIAKGVCQLEKVLRRRRRQRQRQQRTALGRVWQTLLKPFRALGVYDESSGETHNNRHCIACTRSFLPALSKTWRRCDLCAYRVCNEPPCCSHERVAIYSRYVAPLLVCARCRECIDERTSSHHGSGNRVASATGDVRYAGLSLRFVDRGEPELELDPPLRDQWGARSVGRRSSTGSRVKRRAQSDPPPVLALAVSSSGEDASLAEAEPTPLSNVHD